ncbi:ADP-ribosylation factor-like protein 5B [Platysternon megacephalum]|uniref:ADP-ribosylation factor-like protein 5B n=1 Tax=Platysternon megacephalum TaxID=55544 RepID=A0A4D9DYF6_9SAUR|nr:ADP-ribosylation factor-like protein 5B [Platysternon megacephalum]
MILRVHTIQLGFKETMNNSYQKHVRSNKTEILIQLNTAAALLSLIIRFLYQQYKEVQRTQRKRFPPHYQQNREQTPGVLTLEGCSALVWSAFLRALHTTVTGHSPLRQSNSALSPRKRNCCPGLTFITPRELQGWEVHEQKSPRNVFWQSLQTPRKGTLPSLFSFLTQGTRQQYGTSEEFWLGSMTALLVTH